MRTISDYNKALSKLADTLCFIMLDPDHTSPYKEEAINGIENAMFSLATYIQQQENTVEV